MKFVTFVVCALVSVFGARMSYAQSVWVAGSMPRIGPSDAPGSASSISLYAAKGEAESFQVVVRAPSSGLSNVNVPGWPDPVQGPGHRAGSDRSNLGCGPL